MEKNISTERLRLDILTREDAAFIMRLVNSEGWLQFIGDRKVHTPEEALTYIDKINSTENLYYWVVRNNNGDAPMGIISFLKRQYLDDFDIGFAFLPEYEGMGYAYEAATAILAMVNEDPAHATILATTIPENIKSIKLLTKLGFHFDKEINVEDQKIHVYTNAG